MRVINIIIAVALLSVACFSLGCQNDPTGPCFVEFREAILHITNVRDGTTGEAISQITISRLQIDGQQNPIGEWSLYESQNVELRDSSLTCTLPCSFGTQDGTYLLGVSAEGYVDRDVEIPGVHFSVHEGPGCPLFLGGGTRTEFKMAKRKSDAS